MHDNSTIQGMIDGGYSTRAYCQNAKCGHYADLDWPALRDRLGPDHGSMHDDIVPLLVCSKCGGKDIGLIMTPGTKEYGGNPYGRAKGGR